MEHIPSSTPAHLSTEQAQTDMVCIVLADLSFEAVLTRITDVAARAIPGADEVSITLAARPPRTPAASGPLARDADQAQYDAGQGPCLESVASGTTVHVRDQSVDDRWPGYRAGALAAGVCSSLAVPLLAEGTVTGAFNCYARRVDGFDDAAVEVATTLATYAGVVVANASLYFSATSQVEQMREAMVSRAVIEQAKGILMSSRRVAPDAAFDVLVRLSQESHRKLRDVARALVEMTTEDA